VRYVCFLSVLAVVDANADDEVGRGDGAQQLFSASVNLTELRADN
jgi:hypothetical protein